MLYAVPSLTNVAHLPAVAASIAVPAVRLFNGMTFELAEFTRAACTVVTVMGGCPTIDAGLGNVSVTVDAELTIWLVLVSAPVAVITVGNADSADPDNPANVSNCAMVAESAARRPLMSFNGLPAMLFNSVVTLALLISPVVASATAGKVKP